MRELRLDLRLQLSPTGKRDEMAEQAKMDFDSEPADVKAAAEQALASAVSLARSNDPGAETAFNELESLAKCCTDQGLQMRAFEASGEFHERRGAAGTACQKYGIAGKTAECLAVISDLGVEDVERIRYKSARAHHKNDVAFKNLMRAAQPSHSYEQRNKAWASYEEERANSPGRLAARGLGSVDDFRRRLDAATANPSDDDDWRV